ncbi:MAG: hypothetical protein P4L84_17780 [Isosphaeraceae bacterium]|nr:hypothetical protein [Isosphaeraceae bacterium]
MALGALVLATSLAVASYASVWLVPPYLALMAWLLWPSTDRRARATAAAEASDALGSLGAVGPDEGFVESSATSWNDATLSEASLDPSAAAEADSALATVALKTKRGRTRARKAKPAPAVEPATQVTWIRVGPGKFVRVEGANAAVNDDVPAAEAERDRADVAPPLPSSFADAMLDEAEPAPAVQAEPDADALVEPQETSANEADLEVVSAIEPPPALEEALPSDAPAADDVLANTPVEAVDLHRHQPPECTDEASRPPEAADVPSASYTDDPELPMPPAEAVEDVGIEPDPEEAVDPVDVPADGDSSDPGGPAPVAECANLGTDACEDLEDVPSLTPPSPSAGRALWVALREVCPRLTFPLRSVAGRSPTRRVPRAGRGGRIAPVFRRHPRRRHMRRAWRALHARSPPAVLSFLTREATRTPHGPASRLVPAGFVPLLRPSSGRHNRSHHSAVVLAA